MPYDAPGHADELSDELRDRWNETIARAYESQNDALKSRFFSLDPDALQDATATDAITWPGDPGKPAFCVGEDNAQALSDWGLTGRRAVQLEYCEYMVLTARDATGALRPKRVEITTEFREYWACVAMHDPDKVRAMATDVLGAEPSWQELYGVADPHALSADEREIAFGHTVAGHGNDRRLRVAGVPAQPTGRLNMERALFMTHPINGIDDLIYVAIFGAHAYCVSERDQRRQASGDDVFSAFKVTHLACNHADPTISLGVYDLVYHGAQVAFRNPLGMYIRPPNLDAFSYGAGPVPQEWVRFSRGSPGSYQRLVFGPPDDHEAFLDDITLSVGASEQPLVGGYQLLRELEIGPLMQSAATDPIGDAEWELLEPAPGTIACDDAESCKPVRELLARFEAERAGRKAPRTMPEPAPG
ncbi:MAG: hypothetical protein QOG94_406 [Solirubrobacteraceae bacterium]|nr:hypothetical protein [Solirubrobacteraceae bacterium]